MDYKLQIGEESKEGFIKWKTVRDIHGSKPILIFNRRRQIINYLNKRPWITNARSLDSNGNIEYIVK